MPRIIMPLLKEDLEKIFANLPDDKPVWCVLADLYSYVYRKEASGYELQAIKDLGFPKVTRNTWIFIQEKMAEIGRKQNIEGIWRSTWEQLGFEICQDEPSYLKDWSIEYNVKLF